MPAHVTPEQRRTAKQEIVKAVQQGIFASVAREQRGISLHRTTVYRLLKRVQSEEGRAFVDGRHGHAVKLRGEVFTLLTEWCQAHSDVPSSALQCAVSGRRSSVGSSRRNHPQRDFSGYERGTM